MAPLISAVASAALEKVSLMVRDEYAENPYKYTPNFGANLAALIIFSIVLVLQVGQSGYFRQYWFGIPFCMGLALELIGYVGRVKSHSDPLQSGPFMAQIIAVTMAPSLLMAGIYSLPAKYARIYGQKASPMPPMWYSYLFISLDLFAISLQGAGGGMAASASDNGTSTQPGTNVMIAGLVVQVVSMFVFFMFCGHFAYRVHCTRLGNSETHPDPILDDGFDPEFQHIRNRKYFIPHAYAIGITGLFVFIRSVFRVIELGQGWNNNLMIHEKYFLTLETLMMCIAILPLTVIHPGLAFGKQPITVQTGGGCCGGRRKKTKSLAPSVEVKGSNSESYEIGATQA